MTMKIIDQETKSKIVALIKVLLPNVKVYLFGSRARGTNSEMSDIDLALDGGGELPREKVGEVKSVLEATLIPYKIDVVDYYWMSNDMQESIRQEGVEWIA